MAVREEIREGGERRRHNRLLHVLDVAPGRLHALLAFQLALVLEIWGLALGNERSRPVLHFDQEADSEPEIAILVGNRVRLFGSGQHIPIRELFEGFRECDGSRILRVLEGVRDQLS